MTSSPTGTAQYPQAGSPDLSDEDFTTVTVYNRLVDDLPAQALGEIGQTASLEQLPGLAEQITTGGIRGRVIVDLSA